jgi:nuclease S1
VSDGSSGLRLLCWFQHFASQLRRLAAGTALVSGLLLLAPCPGWAWGCQGHQVVAFIAEKHLTPHARAMVEKILKDGPIDPALDRYCKDAPADAMADASTWADDFRSGHPETGPWHYVDIPRGVSKFDLANLCAESSGCVTQAIRDQLAILRAPAAGPQKKGDALRFLIHFVGDLHQPLHAITNNDQGGNCVPVAFFADLPQLRNHDTESYAPNLHSVWDSSILERMTEGKTAQQVADELDRAFAAQAEKWMREPADVEEWPWESFRLAEAIVYGKLPMAIPVEAPVAISSCADDDHISTRMLNLNEQIGQPYQDVAAPVVKEQIAKAGVRLAMLLNQLWP